jgi:hypothetical protein
MSILATLLRKELKRPPTKRGNPPNLQMRKPNDRERWLSIHCNYNHRTFQKGVLIKREEKQQVLASKEKLVQMHFNHKAIKINETSRQEQKDQKGETSGVDSSDNNVAESDNTLDIPKNMQVSLLLFYTCA